MEKVSCDVCSKKFDTGDALKQHKNDAHKQAVGETKHYKSKISKGKLLAILIPMVIVSIIGYGIFWSLTTEGVGTIGSTHIHADFAVFLDGKQITPLPARYFVRSNYMHVESGPGEGTVLHMHATNVPLKMFFESLGMQFDQSCFILDSGDKYCNGGEKTLKMLVKHENGTWEQNNDYQKYIFRDLDKILITYGNESDEQMQLQEMNVTDFSKANSAKEMLLRR